MTDEDGSLTHTDWRAFFDGVSERHVGGSDPVALRRPLADSFR